MANRIAIRARKYIIPSNLTKQVKQRCLGYTLLRTASPKSRTV